MDPLQRPIFVVGTPQSGTGYVFQALGELPGVFALSQHTRDAFDQAEELRPALRGHDSNRRTAADATPEAVSRIRATLADLVAERRDQPESLRFVDGAPRHALRIPFIDAVFPNAMFVYVYRSPRDTIAAMTEAWRSGEYVTYPRLPDWPGPPWSLLLVPGWRELAGESLPEIATAQWIATTRTMLDDLAALAPDRWAVVDYAALAGDPATQLERLAGVLGLKWRETPDIGSPATYVLRPAPDRLRELEGDLQRLLPRTIGLAETAHDLLAAPVSRRPTATPDFEAATRSVHTAGFARLLDRLDASLLLTTGATGKLVCVRHDGARLNTHFEDVPHARAVAAARSEFAVVSGDELQRYRDQGGGSFVAQARVPAPGATAVGFGAGELWIASGDRLEPLDAAPARRWRLPFGEDESESRWRITGIAMATEGPAYVCAESLAGADEGCVVDCRSGEVIARGLTTPRGLRLHDGRLWVVERDPGRLSAIDPESGEREALVELPGAARGLGGAGSVGFVALSRIRRTTTGRPGGPDDPFSGVSVVDFANAELAGYLRFEAEVPEVYDVEVLGHRYPQIRSGRVGFGATA